ncbi:uncharacterized protein CLUP02_10591 [Colletotrichum lupini]|uniref:Uncharacterized protein n=1 Tax=Colletotrichum lupini TaxID=145971 RepID=A0A9Q8SX73_9PEZI|nr:uncharacterized protein CLUP02_10591 [Colletotrichum lupini]UQC85095.1 hypothetical protein CLUP02_10591 [Colletotrichum lupini]
MGRFSKTSIHTSFINLFVPHALGAVTLRHSPEFQSWTLDNHALDHLDSPLAGGVLGLIHHDS